MEHLLSSLNIYTYYNRVLTSYPLPFPTTLKLPNLPYSFYHCLFARWFISSLVYFQF